MKIEKVLVTPSMAKEMLEANVSNRKIKRDVVEFYANEIANDRWKEDTGETIKVSKEGVLIDGQHRLMAIVKANKSVYIHIATSIDKNVFDVIDTGAKRTSSDIFGINNIKNAATLPPMIKMYYMLKSGRTMELRLVSSEKRKSNSELLEAFHQNPNFWNEVSRKSINWYQGFGKVLSASTIGGFYSFFYDINEDSAQSFFNQLCYGTMITNKSISVLRNKLIQNRLSTKKISVSHVNCMIVKCWNCYRKGIELSHFRFDAEKEQMPIAI